MFLHCITTIVASMPVINVINLKQDTNRWETVTKELVSKGVPLDCIQRLVAVYGKELSEQSLRRNVSPVARRFCTPGIIGCYLSHRTFWLKTATEDAPYQIVVEDDVIVADDFLQKLQDILDELENDDWDVLLLGALGCVHPEGKQGFNRISAMVAGGGRKRKHVSRHAHVPRRPFGTHAYVLSKRGARKLLRRAGIVSGHVDVIAWGIPELDILCCNPMLAYQAFDVPSTIGAVTSGIETRLPKLVLCKHTGITLEWVWNEPVLRVGNLVMTYGRCFVFLLGGFGVSIALFHRYPWVFTIQSTVFMLLLGILKIMTRPVGIPEGCQVPEV